MDKLNPIQDEYVRKKCQQLMRLPNKEELASQLGEELFGEGTITTKCKASEASVIDFICFDWFLTTPDGTKVEIREGSIQYN